MGHPVSAQAPQLPPVPAQEAKGTQAYFVFQTWCCLSPPAAGPRLRAQQRRLTFSVAPGPAWGGGPLGQLWGSRLELARASPPPFKAQHHPQAPSGPGTPHLLGLRAFTQPPASLLGGIPFCSSLKAAPGFPHPCFELCSFCTPDGAPYHLAPPPLLPHLRLPLHPPTRPLPVMSRDHRVSLQHPTHAGQPRPLHLRDSEGLLRLQKPEGTCPSPASMNLWNLPGIPPVEVSTVNLLAPSPPPLQHLPHRPSTVPGSARL